MEFHLLSLSFLMFPLPASTLSSGMNALSATTLSDLLEPLYKYLRRRDMPDRWGLILAKSLGERFRLILNQYIK